MGEPTGPWSQDNPFVDQQAAEPEPQWSPDNPFAEPSSALGRPVAVAPTAPPKKPIQSDFLRGLVESTAGGVPKSFGNFLKTVGLDELGDPLVSAGELGAKAAEQYGQPLAPRWQDVNSIGDAFDFAQYQVGSGIGSTLPSLGAGAAGFAAAGPVGAAVAALAASYMQNTGQIKEELDQLGEEDRKGLALSLGVPVALLDAVTPVDLINRIVAKQVAKAASRGLLRQAGRSAVSETVTEGLQESVQYGGTRAGTNKPVSLQEMMERGFEGGLAGGLTGGVLGAGAGAFGARPIQQPKAKDPVTLKPPADPTQEPTSAEKAQRQEEVDKLAAEEKATAERKAQAQNALLRSANAWNTLNADQRKSVVAGLAADQYSVRWKDLTKEAKAAVRQALGGDSYTNLDTSQQPTTTEPIKAVAATVQSPDGRTWEGISHEDAYSKAEAAGAFPPNFSGQANPGFKLNDGRIVSYEEGLKLTGKDSEQIVPSAPAAQGVGGTPEITGEPPAPSVAPEVGEHVTEQMASKTPANLRLLTDYLDSGSGDPRQLVDTFNSLTNKQKALLAIQVKKRGDAGKKRMSEILKLAQSATISSEVVPPTALPSGERRTAPRTDVQQMSMQQLEDERKRAGNKLTQLAIDAEGGPATAEGNRLEREHWQKYMNDLEAERAKRLNPSSDLPIGIGRFKVKRTPGTTDKWTLTTWDEHGGLSRHDEGLTDEEVKKVIPSWNKQRQSVENITAEDTDVVGSIEPDRLSEDILEPQAEQIERTPEEAARRINQPAVPGAEHVGKRFRHPTRNDLVAVITRNTKKSEKPWRVTYFKKNDEGTLEDYLHNHFDTPQEAYDWVTGKPEMEGDKLKGYTEEGPDEGGQPSSPSQGPISPTPEAPQGTTPEGGPTLGPEGAIGTPDDGTSEEERRKKVEDEVKNLNISDKAKDIIRNVLKPDNLKAIDDDLRDLERLSAKLPEKPMGEMSVDELKAAILEYETRTQTPGRDDTLQALRELLAEKLESISPLNRPSLADQVALAEQALDTYAQLTLVPKYGEDLYEDILDNDPLLASKLTDEEFAEVQRLHKDIADKTERAEDAGETDVRGSGLMTSLPEIPIEERLPDINQSIEDKTEDGIEAIQSRIDELRTRLVSIKDEDAKKRTQDEINILTQKIEELKSRPPVESIDLSRLNRLQQKILDLTQVEKLLQDVGPVDANRTNKTYENLDLDTLDRIIDESEANFEKGLITEAQFRKILGNVSDAKRAIKAREAGSSPAPPKFKMPDSIGKDLNKFDDDRLKNIKKAIAGLLQSPDVRGTPQEKILKDELNRIFDYEAEKREKNRGKLSDESGELRPFAWKVPSLRRKAVKTAVRSGLPHYEQVIAERIGLEEDPVNPYTISDYFRKLYAYIFRQGAHIGSAERLSGKRLQAHESPYIFAQMSNRFLTQAEEYLRGQGPFLPDDQGGFVPTGTPSLAQISSLVGDDVERLGWLAMARRELFERATRNRTIGIDPVAAKLMYLNTPKAYHDAADALAQYNHDLASYGVWGGLISEETRAKFDTMFYAPIRRIFGTEIEGAGSSEVTPRGRGKRGVGGENPIKRYRGSTRRMVNPVEVTVDMTARVIRAANQNKVAALLVDLAKGNPDAYRGVLEPASAAVRNKIKADLKAKAEAAKAEAADAGVELTLTEAERFIGTMGDDALAIRDNVLNVWIDGKLEHWVMHPDLAYSMKSLTPHELGIMWRVLGMPAQVQRNLIVNDPTFIMTMSMVDTFQAFVNSRYGFVPVLDSFRGWWAAVNNTPEFANYRRGGGGLSSLTSKQYARSKTSLHDIVGATSDQTPIAQAVHQLKTMHPIEAWRTLVSPVAEAARVGEYLRARGRGASVVESVYAAKTITGNYSLQGGEMQALARMAVFMNPALQVLDKTARVIADNPIKWFMRSSVLAGISMMIYMANSDDDEIRDLRQTQGGQRYFFIRMPTGQIIKIRKPFFEGALFAGGVEAAMDQMRGDNPDAFNLWRDAVLQEIKVNVLPTIGVIPAQYWANKDWLSGAPIRPEANEMLEPMFQSRASTGTAARIIGEKTNTSPAVIEWLTRSQFGLLGSAVLNAIEGAIEWKQSGEWPIAEELPFVSRVLSRYPSNNVAPIRNFYDRAKDIERVAETVEYMALNEPEMLEHYIEKHEQEIALIDVFKDTRKQLADYRQGIEDVSTAGADVVPPSQRREYTDEFLRVMIEMARSANLMHQAVTEATE